MGVDTRLLGKPPDFHGEHERWRDWAVVFRGYAGAAVPGLGELMPWAAAHMAPVLNATLAGSQSAASWQLYWMLLMLLNDGPLHILLNAGDGEGLEGWRNLHERYEPRVRMRYAAQLMAIMSFSFAGDLVERVGAWEREIGHYERASNKGLDDEVRIGVFLLRLPDGPVKTHLLLRVDRLQAWTDFRDEVVAITRAMSAAQTVPSPMDIGAVADEDGDGEYDIDALGAKGKGRGKGTKGGGKGGKAARPA